MTDPRERLQALIGRLRVHRAELLTVGANVTELREDLKSAADRLEALIAESPRLLDQKNEKKDDEELARSQPRKVIT